MHYGTLVVISSDNRGSNINAEVERLLEPGKYDWWDSWQIGGRWTGTLSGYDPVKDGRNIKPCNLCGATGVRTDGEGIANGMPSRIIDTKDHPRNGQVGWCNGCDGRGCAVKWPTEWGRHEGDVVPVEALIDEHLTNFHHFVFDGYGVFSRERYVPWINSGEFEQLAVPTLDWIKREFVGGIAVVVDVHN